MATMDILWMLVFEPELGVIPFGRPPVGVVSGTLVRSVVVFDGPMKVWVGLGWVVKVVTTVLDLDVVGVVTLEVVVVPGVMVGVSAGIVKTGLMMPEHVDL